MAEESLPQHRTCEVCGEESPAGEFAISAPSGRWIHAGTEDSQGEIMRLRKNNDRLAEEVERLKDTTSPTSTLAIGKALLDERARIRRDLLAEVESFLGQEIHPDDPLCVGRLAERAYFAQSLRLILNRIVPGEG